jgi:acetylornithine deacetylase/succinyl-diaminopimelate desuccinylase-like protein
MPPQVRPVTIQYEMERVLNGLGIEYDLEFYKSLLGHEGKQVEPLVRSAEEVHQHLFGETIKPEPPDRASIWTDTNVYNEVGIPCVKIGPRGKRVARQEEIEIDQMLNAAKIYALMALDICSRERTV